MSILSNRYSISRAVAVAAVLCFVIIAAPASNALFHKIYVATSHIVWNEKASTVEVKHSFLWHDLETVLTVRSDNRFSFDQGEDVSVPLLKEYIADRFILEIDGKKQQLLWVGMAFDNDKLHVRYTINRAKPPQKLLILDGLMTDILETHKNTVIVEAYGKKWEHNLNRKDVEVKLDLSK